MNADVLIGLFRDDSPEAREVFEDAVRAMTHEELVRALEQLAAAMRAPSAAKNAEAVIVASRLLGIAGYPNYLLFPAHVLVAARQVLRGTFPESWSGAEQWRTPLRQATATTERFAIALRWLATIRAGAWDGEGGGGTAAVRVFRDGRVVARGANLAVLARYARRAEGVTLIVHERIPPRSTAEQQRAWWSGVLHLFFSDGGAASVPWADFEAMERWTSNRLRDRRSWFAGTPVVVIDGPTQRPPSRTP